MKNIKNLMTCKSDNLATPSKLYNLIVNEKGFIDCFPYLSTYDQYEKQYVNERLFINPPFSELNKERFSLYLDNLYRNGNKILLLIPSRTDTKIFHQILNYGATLYFFEGRLHFNDSLKPSTFPSVLIYIQRGIFNFHVYNFGKFDYIYSLIKKSNL